MVSHFVSAGHDVCIDVARTLCAQNGPARVTLKLRMLNMYFGFWLMVLDGFEGWHTLEVEGIVLDVRPKELLYEQ